MTYILSIGVAMVIGCSVDGGDQIRLFNMDIGTYSSYATCKAAGIETQRGFSCKKELK